MRARQGSAHLQSQNINLEDCYRFEAGLGYSEKDFIFKKKKVLALNIFTTCKDSGFAY